MIEYEVKLPGFVYQIWPICIFWLHWTDRDSSWFSRLEDGMYHIGTLPTLQSVSCGERSKPRENRLRRFMEWSLPATTRQQNWIYVSYRLGCNLLIIVKIVNWNRWFYLLIKWTSKIIGTCKFSFFSMNVQVFVKYINDAFTLAVCWLTSCLKTHKLRKNWVITQYFQYFMQKWMRFYKNVWLCHFKTVLLQSDKSYCTVFYRKLLKQKNINHGGKLTKSNKLSPEKQVVVLYFYNGACPVGLNAIRL